MHLINSMEYENCPLFDFAIFPFDSANSQSDGLPNFTLLKKTSIWWKLKTVKWKITRITIRNLKVKSLL